MRLFSWLFDYRWPSWRAQWEAVLKADPQVKPPHPTSQLETGIERMERERDKEILKEMGVSDK